jgi:aryl carrier-like protein
MCLLLATSTVLVEAQKTAALQKAPAAKKPAWAPRKAESTRKAPEQPRPKVLDPQLELLYKISGHSPRPWVVEGTVKQFAHDFQTGAKDPDRFLSEVRSNQPALVKEWEAAPREKRIFVIGAGKDSAKVSELAEPWKSDGYAVFFYDFCRPLCSSQAVGAMFGSPAKPCYITLHPPRSANTSRLRSR